LWLNTYLYYNLIVPFSREQHNGLFQNHIFNTINNLDHILPLILCIVVWSFCRSCGLCVLLCFTILVGDQFFHWKSFHIFFVSTNLIIFFRHQGINL